MSTRSGPITMSDVGSCVGGIFSCVGITSLHRIFARRTLGVGILPGRHLMPGCRGKHVQLTLGRVYYTWLPGNGSRVAGDCPLVVLVHGFAGDSSVFTHPQRSCYADELARAGYDVLCFDNYGHGFSDGPDTEYCAELFASQLAELLETLDITRDFDLMGFSMGGAIAAVYAYRFPERVRRLVLQAPAIAKGPAPAPLRPWALAGMLPFVSEMISKKVIPTLGEGANEGNEAVVRACHRLVARKWVVGGPGSFCLGEHEQEVLSKLDPTIHVHVLWGEADGVVPFSQAERITEALGSRLATIRTVAKADHMTFADGPEDVRQIFRRDLLQALQADTAHI